MSAIDTWAASVRKNMDGQLKVAALAFKDIIGQQLSIPGTGRFYKRRKGPGFKNVKLAGPLVKGQKRQTTKVRNLTKYHQASVAGAPPARDFGALFRSRFAEKSGPEQYSVGVAAKYAEGLEKGTKKVAARPFMFPSLQKFKPLFAQLIKVR